MNSNIYAQAYRAGHALAGLAGRLRFAVARDSFGRGPEDYKQADWLASELEHEWRYDHGHERWHHFTGVRWEPDQETAIAYKVADRARRAIARGTWNTGGRELGESGTKTMLALLRVASQKRAIEALGTFPDYRTTGSDWDQNPDLLGCNNGIVDLTTGVLRKANPDDLVTRTVGFDFDPEAECPTVLAFLGQVFADRDGKPQPELVEYVLTVLGAALFGHSKPQQFYVAVGPGGAGKGTLFRLVAHVLGGPTAYATFPSANLYTASRFGQPSSDRARRDLVELQGRRFAYISEPEPPFDDLMLLGHSGEDYITARPLNSNNVVSFIPTHTIMFSTNTPPPIREVGTNMRRRLRVIPFVRTFGDHPDTDLRTKLEAESAGFLALLVRHAVAYNANPSVLDYERAPQVVQDESKAYIEANTPLAGFFRDVAYLDARAKAEAKDLYDEYKVWFASTEQEGDPLTQIKFGQYLKHTMHLEQDRLGVSRRTFYLGIGLRDQSGGLNEADQRGSDQ